MSVEIEIDNQTTFVFRLQFPQGVSVANSKGKLPLHYAAREGRTDMVAFLLRVNPQTAAITSGKDKLALHFAAGEGHLEIVRHLLHIYPYGVLRPSKKGKLAIHFAARWGHVRVAQELLRVAPSTISDVDWEGSLPLHEAAREGEFQMCKFLLERYPEGICRSNMRGEIPLFPAIRTDNLDLVILFLRMWPKSAKHVLQIVREEDKVGDWNPQILELCLRGAVENFTGCQMMDGWIPSCRGCGLDCVVSGVFAPIASRRPQSPMAEICGTIHHHNDTKSPKLLDCDESNPILQISIPRSKSPILGQAEVDRKKRPPSYQNRINRKRCRYGALQTQESSSASLSQRPFIHLHAALECGASLVVVRCILNRFPHQLTEADGLKQYPLHKAVSCCRKDDEVSMIVEDILTPIPKIAQKRDFQKRLPLHLALTACAAFTLIKPLVEANASASVDLCKVTDPRFHNVPPLIMAAEHDCDLSTVYTLLRADPSILEVKPRETS